jgi:small subunit ribosomal protein S4
VARDIDAKCRQCRREGEKLFLKGEKCFTDKCAIERRNYAPGQHGQKGSRLSGYGVQLRAKQKIRRTYGILERQFRRVYAQADSM